MCDFPDEIILRILSFCKLSNSLFAVDKRFERLCNSLFDPSLYDNYYIKKSSSRGDHNSIKKLLKDDRVNPSCDDNYSIKAASSNGYVLVVDLLIKSEKVDVSKCIVLGSMKGHYSVVKRLLDISSEMDIYFSVLFSLKNKNYEILNLLLDKLNVTCLFVILKLLGYSKLDRDTKDDLFVKLYSRKNYLEVIDKILQDQRIRYN